MFKVAKLFARVQTLHDMAMAVLKAGNLDAAKGYRAELVATYHQLNEAIMSYIELLTIEERAKIWKQFDAHQGYLECEWHDALSQVRVSDLT